MSIETSCLLASIERAQKHLLSALENLQGNDDVSETKVDLATAVGALVTAQREAECIEKDLQVAGMSFTAQCAAAEAGGEP